MNRNLRDTSLLRLTKEEETKEHKINIYSLNGDAKALVYDVQDEILAQGQDL